MQHKSAMAFQPGLHLWDFVRPVAIQDQVQLAIAGELAVQPPQEFQEFLVAVSAVALPDDFAI